MNQIDFWHADKDSRNAKPGLKILSWTWLKMLSANQIPRFLNQLYLKKKLKNQFDFWNVVINSRNIKDGL